MRDRTGTAAPAPRRAGSRARRIGNEQRGAHRLRNAAAAIDRHGTARRGHDPAIGGADHRRPLGRLRARADRRRDRQRLVDQLDLDQHRVGARRIGDGERPPAAQRMLPDHRDRAFTRGQARADDARLAQRRARVVEREALAEAAEIERERTGRGDPCGAAVEHEIAPARPGEPPIGSRIEQA
ncbi:hypothetical protein QP176_18085 [Sphingomonas aerolata]